MKIAFDLDEVLADLLPALIEFHNSNHGTNLTRQNFTSNKFWEVWGGTKEEAIQKVYNFHKSEHFGTIKPTQESHKVLDLLKKDNELFIITSRSQDFSQTTMDWINQHFPKTFSNIHFANHYSQSGEPVTKAKICDSLGIDILIEDSVDHALDCLSPNRKILLVDHPWNKSFDLPKGVYRINSLKEIIDFI